MKKIVQAVALLILVALCTSSLEILIKHTFPGAIFLGVHIAKLTYIGDALGGGSSQGVLCRWASVVPGRGGTSRSGLSVPRSTEGSPLWIEMALN